MHRCLCIDEVLRTIAVHIASQWPSRRALLYMALTCKTFYGPAMDTLWEDLPGLRPLLSLLPRNAYDFPKERIRFRGTIVESENPGSLDITRIPTEAEWAPVQRIARRLRGLLMPLIDSDDPNVVSYRSTLILCDHYPEPILFPSLRDLYVVDGEFSSYSRIFGTSPCLETVQFLPFDRDSVTELFTALDSDTATCSLLQLHVDFDFMKTTGYGVDNPSLAEAISRVVLRQKALESLSVPSHVSEEAWIHLAHSPSLWLLSIDFYGAVYHGVLKPSPANFAGLTRLYLQAAWHNDDVAALASFLGTFSHTSPLQQLDLGFTTSPTDTSLPDFFAAVAGFTQLTRCKLEFFPALNSTWDGPPVSASVLAPLFRTTMYGLTQLELSRLPMTVSPDVVRRMAAAWPDVRSISLGQRHRKSTSTLTLEDIAPLIVEDCPSIRHFGAIFLSATQPDWDAPASSEQPDMTVDVGYSSLRLQDAPHIAAVLAALLPTGALVTNGSRETRQTVAEINRLKQDMVSKRHKKRGRKRSKALQADY